MLYCNSKIHLIVIQQYDRTMAGSLLTQFSKSNYFLLNSTYLDSQAIIFLIMYPLLENSTTCIAVFGQIIRIWEKMHFTNDPIVPFSKGQLISKCPYEKSVLSKIPMKKFPRFLPQLLNQKIKAVYYTNQGLFNIIGLIKFLI